MDVRKKLVKLVKRAITDWKHGDVSEMIADHLIANGVTVQESDGCEYCEEYKDLPEHFISGKPVGRVFDTCIQPNENGLWHLEVPCGADIGIRFCPMCGREFSKPLKGD